MTQYPDLFAALAAPFEPDQVKRRQAPGGLQFHYITARTAANRLDSVVGPENWWDEYIPLENSVVCKLTLRLPDGSTITKCDAGGYAGMADEGDDDKSGFSDSFKRAAAKFGVARYLYGDGVPDFVRGRAPARESASREAPPRPTQPDGPRTNVNLPASGAPSPHGTPRSGKALFAWTKDQEQRYEVALLKYLNDWAKLQEFPGRMVDWDPEQVERAYAEAVRKLKSNQPVADRGDAYEDALSN